MSRRTWALLAAGLVLALAAAVWAGTGRGQYTARLDPGNPGPDGARAVARVLADQGVAVGVVRGARALEETSVDGATVVVTSPEALGVSTARRLLDHADGGPVLVVEPSGPVAALLGYAGQPAAESPGGPLPADCDDPRLAGLELDVAGTTAYTATAGGCFPAAGGFGYAPQRGGVAFLGSGEALTNRAVVRGDNAAVALRLLGGADRVVWYVPDPADLAAGDEVGLAALLPRWLVPALWLAGLVVLATMVWRGRRLGPLVREPLPVPVRAVETTLARGRLYRRGGDRAHAAAVLREASRDRAIGHLGLPRRTPPAVVVAETARATGLDPAEVAALLDPAAGVPADDRALTALARGLADLDDRLLPSPTPHPGSTR